MLNEYYKYSTLSQGAYANFKGQYNAASVLSALQQPKLGDFTSAQADNFISDNWEVVDQSNDVVYGASGFSAALFHNTDTGEYVFANRRTTESVDVWFADAWGME